MNSAGAARTRTTGKRASASEKQSLGRAAKRIKTEHLNGDHTSAKSASQGVVGNKKKVVKKWTPALWAQPLKHTHNKPYAVLVLNQPIENRDLFVRICGKGEPYIVAADGGLNQIKDLELDEDAERICWPDAVCGDLDSVDQDVLDHYQNQGTEVEQDPDQNSTDFTKCLKLINSKKDELLTRAYENAPAHRAKLSSKLDIYVFGGLGGRADQAFSQLHHLYKASEDPALACGDIFLVTPKSIIFCLNKGWNIIDTPVYPTLFAENVGIIPIAKPAKITTHGLQWNVKDWPTSFGTQMSTSNHILGSFVSVHTTERVLFTVELSDEEQDPANILPAAFNHKVKIELALSDSEEELQEESSDELAREPDDESEDDAINGQSSNGTITEAQVEFMRLEATIRGLRKDIDNLQRRELAAAAKKLEKEAREWDRKPRKSVGSGFKRPSYTRYM